LGDHRSFQLAEGRNPDFNLGWTCEHRGGHHFVLVPGPAEQFSPRLCAGLSSLAPRFTFLREWRRSSACTSLATVEKIGPSSEASAASQFCSRLLMVFSGIGIAPELVNIRAIRLERSPPEPLVGASPAPTPVTKDSGGGAAAAAKSRHHLLRHRPAPHGRSRPMVARTPAAVVHSGLVVRSGSFLSGRLRSRWLGHRRRRRL